VGAHLLGPPQHVQAGALTELEIGDEELEGFPGECGPGFLHPLDRVHVMPLLPKKDLEHLAHRAFVVHEEDARHLTLSPRLRRAPEPRRAAAGSKTACPLPLRSSARDHRPGSRPPDAPWAGRAPSPPPSS